MCVAYNHRPKRMHKIMDKAKPVAKRGRKATGLLQDRRVARGVKTAVLTLGEGNAVFF